MDKTTICNLALSALASSADLANVDTERSKEAIACRMVFDAAVERVLRVFPWPFATKRGLLALVETYTDDEWTYAYRYPADAVAFRSLRNQYKQRVNIRASRVSYRVIADDVGRLILTDEVSAFGEWTTRIDDPERFDGDFCIALGFYIAYLIAPRITAGDQFQLGEKAYKKFFVEIEKAQKAALMEEQDDDLPDADLILIRE